MSCPHPRTPVERVVGEFTEIVCPDCHARLASDSSAVDETLICGKLGRASQACGLAPEHDGRHSYTVDVVAEVATPEQIQAVYDEAFAQGILEEPSVFNADDGVTGARIENGQLIVTVAPAG